MVTPWAQEKNRQRHRAVQWYEKKLFSYKPISYLIGTSAQDIGMIFFQLLLFNL